MQYVCPLLAVKDMEASKKFYQSVMGMSVLLDLGANVTLSGGLSLQSFDTWKGFINTDEVTFGANDAEMYFETETFEKFVKQHEKNLDVIVKKQQDWGQNVIRFYDPDKHIIEVGESMTVVCMRMQNEGMNIEQIAEKTGFTPEHVANLLMMGATAKNKKQS